MTRTKALSVECGKLRYVTHRSAVTAMKKAIAAVRKGERGIRYSDAYYCRHCEGFHPTSKSRRTFEKSNMVPSSRVPHVSTVTR